MEAPPLKNIANWTGDVSRTMTMASGRTTLLFQRRRRLKEPTPRRHHRPPDCGHGLVQLPEDGGDRAW